MLLDSNILIYAAEPTGAFLSRWVEDAVIAGAALTNRLPLVTRNEEDFGHIDGLQIINPFRQQNQE